MRPSRSANPSIARTLRSTSAASSSSLLYFMDCPFFMDAPFLPGPGERTAPLSAKEEAGLGL